MPDVSDGRTYYCGSCEALALQLDAVREALNPFAAIDLRNGEGPYTAADVLRARAALRGNRMNVDSQIAHQLAVIDEIRRERDRQDQKWGGPEHDDGHEEKHWRFFVHEHAEHAYGAHFRAEMIQVAALAIAAVESFDRKEAARG